MLQQQTTDKPAWEAPVLEIASVSSSTLGGFGIVDDGFLDS